MPVMGFFHSTRQYLLRDAQSNEALAVVEADNLEQACERAALVQRRTKLFEASVALTVEEIRGVMALPVFKDAFFELLAAANKRRLLH